MADASNQNLSSNNSRLSDVDRRQFQRDAYIFREHEQGDRAYIIAKGKFVTLPYNSTFIKFANRPKKIPIGATVATKSDN